MAKRARGRPRKLKAALPRKTVLDALRDGCSRHDAAGLAGVNYSTLLDEEDRDPKFAAAIVKAELEGKQHCIRQVKAKKPEFILERKYWREFARRNPDSLPLQTVVGVVSRLFTRWLARIPLDHQGALLADLESTLDELRLAAGGGE